MRKLTLIAAASALAIGGAGIAMASQGAAGYGKAPGARMAAALEKADSNGDGDITLEEAKAHGAERFEKMDINTDGALSKADRKAYDEQRFAKADTNADGEISPQEMTAAREVREAETVRRQPQVREKAPRRQHSS